MSTIATATPLLDHDASAPETVPPPARERVRTAALLVLAACWLSSWGTVLEGTGASEATGAERTGAPGALVLLAAWGLATTTLLARTRRGIRTGAAFVDGVLAAGLTALLVSEHAWVPGAALREAWVPVFAPLALLAILDGALTATGRETRDVAMVRSLSALFAGACFVVAAAWLPAGACVLLGLPSLLLAVSRGGTEARRAIEGTLLVLGLVAAFAPALHDAIASAPPAVGTEGLARYGWTVAAGVVAFASVHGVLRPDRTPAPRA